MAGSGIWAVGQESGRRPPFLESLFGSSVGLQGVVQSTASVHTSAAVSGSGTQLCFPRAPRQYLWVSGPGTHRTFLTDMLAFLEFRGEGSPLLIASLLLRPTKPLMEMDVST